MVDVLRDLVLGSSARVLLSVLQRVTRLVFIPVLGLVPMTVMSVLVAMKTTLDIAWVSGRGMLSGAVL